MSVVTSWLRVTEPAVERCRRLYRSTVTNKNPGFQPYYARNVRNAMTHTHAHGKYVSMNRRQILLFLFLLLRKKRRRIKRKHRFWIRDIFRELKQFSLVYSWISTTMITSRFIIVSARSLLSLIFCSTRWNWRCCP